MIQLKAPMVGQVIRVEAKAGATVAQDDAVVVLESMKMELPVTAPKDGIVKQVRVETGDIVQEGDVVAVIE